MSETTVRYGASESLAPGGPFDDMSGRTIVGLPLDDPHPFSSLATGRPDVGLDDGTLGAQALFKVRLADNAVRHDTARTIVDKMYAWRGYKVAWHAHRRSNRITLVASHGTAPMATISIAFDSESGLLVDTLFSQELDTLRKRGLRIAEFTKLAVDGATRSKRVLATLFHIAYIYAHRMNGYTDLLVEVNPRHVRFYEAMLGFKRFGSERMNPRVDAPAVLLRLEFSHLAEQLARFGGRPYLARSQKSLYAYGFSAEEEHRVMKRLMALG